MNIYVRNIDYVDPKDELPSGGVVEFEDDQAEVSLEEYGRDAWLFLESEIGETINGFEASFVEDFSSKAYHFEKNESGDGFVIYDIAPQVP